MENPVVYPKFRWVVAFASAWGWFTFGVTVLTFSPMFPVMAKEFGVQIGTLVIGVMAFNSIACAVGTILCGSLIDKFGPRKLLLASSILVFIYCLLIPVCSHTYWQLVALRIYGGLVSGPLFATMAALTQRWFPRHEHGTVIGINKGVFAVGAGFLFLTVPPLMQHFHGAWRTVSALGGVLLFIQVLLTTMILFGKEPAVVRYAASAGKVRRNAWAKTLRLPVFWTGAALLAVAQGVMQSVNGVMPSYLMTPSPMG
jgi:MFS family permease